MHPTRSGYSLKALLVALSPFWVLASGCRNEPGPTEISGPTMGTVYHVKVASLPDGIGPGALQAEFEKVLAEIDRQMSTWRDDSEISRFNASSSTDGFPVSPAFAEVVEQAMEVNQGTGGTFDITIGPLVRLWGFGPGGAEQEIPDPDAIERLLRPPGAAGLRVRTAPPALQKNDPTVEIDVSAIAKGYAVDRIADHLEARGIHAYMVEIGGEVRASGRKGNGQKWRIAIDRPSPTGGGFVDVIELDGQAVATSGDYRNFFEFEGTRYAHVLDPRTGWPVAHDLVSVSVLADTCAFADAMATALLVMGPAEGLQFARESGLAVLMVIRSGDRFETVSTEAYRSSSIQE